MFLCFEYSKYIFLFHVYIGQLILLFFHEAMLFLHCNGTICFRKFRFKFRNAMLTMLVN